VPILLLKNGRCVKGRNFSSLRDTGNPITAAKVYDAQRVDELVFLDIAATEENRRILFDVVQGVAEQCFMPLTVGGGVRTLDDMRRLLQTGADKVTINTAAVERPALVQEAARTFGSANVVVSIDAKRRAGGGRHEVWTHSGRQATLLEAVQWARQVVAAGAGEILITSIDREGTMAGYDLELVGAVADAVAVPVIANGGAGTLQHLVEAVTIGHASAVAASSIFHFTDQSPIKARSYMQGAGLHVRAA
jgi:cyclase